MKNNNFLFWLSVAITSTMLITSCKKEQDNSPVSKNALTVENLEGTWDMSLQETHPDIFICPNLLKTVEDVEWAYIVITEDEIEATAKLIPSPWNLDDFCSGQKYYSINDSEHLLIIENGQQAIFKYTLSDNGTKLTVTVLEPGLDPDYPNGAFEVYYKRSIDCTIPGIIPVIAQPTNWTCWATTATMMISWHDNQSYTIQQAMALVDTIYLNKFNNDEGLTDTEANQFFNLVGFDYEPNMSYSVTGFKELCEAYGPLLVTTDEDSGPYWAIHARVVTGMHGDGTPENTFLYINDPAGGIQVIETYKEFIQKFEDVAGSGYQGIQVVHY